MKKFWLLCLCLASLGLAGCFHIPDEDWLPSKNKINTWDTQKDDEMDQALNDIMEWINMFSSHRDDENNDENNDESNGANTEELDENNIEVEDETISDEEISDDGIENEVVENEMIKEKIPSDE